MASTKNFSDKNLPPAASSSSGEAAPSGKGVARAPMKSRKLDRTLHELENAFSDWESLSGGTATAPPMESVQKSKGNDKSEAEFREKTKKLLTQLRKQLSELND